MKTLTNILLLFFPLTIFAQGFIPMDTIETPSILMEKISNRIATTFIVDFTGDGNQDYVCRTDFLDKTEPYYIEFWISSDLKIIKEKTKYMENFNFFWFVNIDLDPEPEIFSATGWTEGIDYCFIDQKLQTGKDSILFYLNPIIIENDKMYWGYAWDISDILLKTENNNIELRTSLNHNIDREGAEITIPKNQTIFPVIFFQGHSTQPDVQIGKINNIEWMNIEEIKVRTHNSK